MGGNIFMTMASLVVSAVRLRASGTWRDVLLLSVGALILPLFFATAATAGPSRTAPHGIAFVINEVPDNAMGERHRGSVIWRINRIQAAGHRTNSSFTPTSRFRW